MMRSKYLVLPVLNLTWIRKYAVDAALPFSVKLLIRLGDPCSLSSAILPSYVIFQRTCNLQIKKSSHGKKSQNHSKCVISSPLLYEICAILGFVVAIWLTSKLDCLLTAEYSKGLTLPARQPFYHPWNISREKCITKCLLVAL